MPCIVGIAISFRLVFRFRYGIRKCFILYLCDEVADRSNTIPDRNLGSGGVGICQIAAGNAIVKMRVDVKEPGARGGAKQSIPGEHTVPLHQ